MKYQAVCSAVSLAPVAPVAPLPPPVPRVWAGWVRVRALAHAIGSHLYAGLQAWAGSLRRAPRPPRAPAPTVLDLGTLSPHLARDLHLHASGEGRVEHHRAVERYAQLRASLPLRPPL